MSGIIWGIYKKNQNIDIESMGIKMQEGMSYYKVDKYNSFSSDKIFMGCGLQYITEESLSEVLPYYDQKDKYIITADAIIDNREELLEELGLYNKKVSDFSDSEYILMSYKKWGESCVNYLLGDYCFVIYDEINDKVFAVRDHTGMRTFYYINNDNYFAFCTVNRPLQKLINNLTLNERWITDYIALVGVLQTSEDKETIYKDIYELPSGNCLTLNNYDININRYYDPVSSVKPLKLNSEKEYIDEFLRIYKEAVRCRLRCRENVGTQLSSGLDSTSIAALSAIELEKENKKLISYTSIPVKDFKKETKGVIYNESSKVRQFLKDYKNIEPKFLSFENENSLTCINELIYICEQPYKILENSVWIKGISEEAKKDNCRVLLTGQFGNSSISFGDFFTCERTFIKEGKILTAIKELNKAAKLHNFSRKRLIKDLIHSFHSYEYLQKEFLKNHPDFNRYNYCPVNKDLLKKYNVSERFDRGDLNCFPSREQDLNSIKKYRVNPIGFSHIATFNTKISLANNIITRDPTRDKRVIDFCLSLPCEMYLKDGIERYLIRKSMEGFVTDSIRLNLDSRGRQSGDWFFRIKDKIKYIIQASEEAINNHEINKYFDIPYLKSELQIIKDGDYEELSRIRMFIVLIIFNEYYKALKKLSITCC